MQKVLHQTVSSKTFCNTKNKIHHSYGIVSTLYGVLSIVRRMNEQDLQMQKLHSADL